MDVQLGGEPVTLTTAFQAFLAALVAWGTFDLTDEQAGLIMAAVAAVLAVYRAWVTRDTLLSVGLGAISALVALGAGYGYEFTENQMAAITGIAAVVFGFIQQQRTEPIATPTFARGVWAGPRYGTDSPNPVGQAAGNPPVT